MMLTWTTLAGNLDLEINALYYFIPLGNEILDCAPGEHGDPGPPGPDGQSGFRGETGQKGNAFQVS